MLELNRGVDEMNQGGEAELARLGHPRLSQAASLFSDNEDGKSSTQMSALEAKQLQSMQSCSLQIYRM